MLWFDGKGQETNPANMLGSDDIPLQQGDALATLGDACVKGTLQLPYKVIFYMCP